LCPVQFSSSCRMGADGFADGDARGHRRVAVIRHARTYSAAERESYRRRSMHARMSDPWRSLLRQLHTNLLPDRTYAPAALRWTCNLRPVLRQGAQLLRSRFATALARPTRLVHGTGGRMRAVGQATRLSVNLVLQARFTPAGYGSSDLWRGLRRGDHRTAFELRSSRMW
jgi:hypothetical protein